MRQTKILLLLFALPLLCINGIPARAEKPGSRIQKILLLRPCHQSYKGIPLLEAVPPGDPLAVKMEAMERTTFLRELAILHGMLEDSLQSCGLIGQKEPLYLLISGRVGGFPMHGFFLKTAGKIEAKRGVTYVDLQNLEKDYRTLGSVTQIFPHEQAHLYMRLFSGIDPVKMESYSSDIHYFSMVTNYFTAFNEGFAESFENIARIHEPDTATCAGIRRDAARKEHYLGQRTGGFERDFRWPLRLGIYRLTMLLWYQPLEDYKRFAWVTRGWARYRPEPLDRGSAEWRLMHRNACVRPDTTCPANRAVCASSEGVINTFFTRLMESDAKSCNRPNEKLSPMQNQVLKEFSVMRTCFRGLPQGRSLLDAFVSGYILRYPSEETIVRRVYRDACGVEYTGTGIPELWLFNPGHRHHSLVMDQFGGTEIPYYTMNLNTAGVEDLLTFRGLDERTAAKIIRYRDSAGQFRSWGDLDHLPGGLKQAGELLKKAKLDPEVLEKYGEGEAFTITSFFTGLGMRILKMAALLFILSFAVRMVFMISRREKSGRMVLAAMTAFGKAILFLLFAIGAFFLPWPPVYLFAALSVAILAVDLFRTRRRLDRRTEVVISTLLICLPLAYSLV